MGGPVAKIERAKNGFEVEMCDPKIKRENEASDTGYKDPYVTFVFSTVDELMTFLKENLEKAIPMDDYATSFDEAVKED